MCILLLSTDLPQYTVEENNRLSEFLREFCIDKEVIVQGDMNFPTIRWDLDDVYSQYMSPLDREFCDLFSDLGLTQVIEGPTHFPSGNVLDIFLTNSPDRLGCYKILSPLPRCHHSPVLVEVVFQNAAINEDVSNRLNKPYYLWSRGRYDLIAQCISFIDWNSEFHGLDTHQKYSRLLNILDPLIRQYIPMKTNSPAAVPWQTNPPRSIIRAKQEAWQSYKLARSRVGRGSQLAVTEWNRFCACNRTIQNFAINSQKEYELVLTDQLGTHPKLFHSYINHRKKGRPSVGPLKNSNGALVDDPKLMADLFLRSFSGVFVTHAPTNPAPNQLCEDHLESIHVTYDDVAAVIAKMDSDSSIGLDGIHPRLLKNLSHILSLPLALIFDSSLREGRLPLEWLTSSVVPIFKSKSRYDPLNYRPVSLTSVPCKTLERIIAGHLTAYLDQNRILSEHQYGFRSTPQLTNLS